MYVYYVYYVYRVKMVEHFRTMMTRMLVYLVFTASPVLGMFPFMNGNRAVYIEAQGMREKCHGGLCGGMAHYPAKPGIHYYATFDVPELPEV